MLERDEIVAHHEAGHVAAALWLRVPVQRVTIVEDGEASGRTTHPEFSETIWETLEYERDSCRARRFAEGHIMVAFAGSVAEAMFDPKPRESTDEWDHDYGIVLDLALRMTGSEEESFAYQQWLYQRTVNLMARPDRVAAVDGIVAALLERRTLSGRAAQRAAKAGIERALEERVGRALPFQVRSTD